jgi:serine/threonine-protein kinase
LTGGKFAIRHRGDYKRSIQEDVPAEFIRVLERILDSDPDRRPQTAIELLTELKIIKRGNVPLSEEPIRGDFRTDAEPVIIVAIASAYPGAGATFASMALSDTLARIKVAHALVECPGGYGELYALLNGAVRMPKGAIYSQAGVEQAAVPAWRQGSVAYYPLSPNDEGIHNPDNDYTNWLKRLGVPIVLLDVSSRWERSEVKEWLIRSADHIGLVADCFPAKWSHRRQLSCVELAEEASKHRISCAWLANRDQPFADRKNWLSLFPNKPEVSIPDIGSPAMINALWKGEGLPKDKTTSFEFDGAFRKWIAKVTGIR